jgi:signal transduction histidine kinase
MKMRDQIKILMIDDDEEDFMITRDLFADMNHSEFIVDWVPSSEEGLKRIGKREHDVYLVDYSLGAGIGLDLIREAIQNGCEEPMILLTGQNEFEIDEQALKSGAADYLIKGMISGRELERAIRYSIEQAKNIKEIKVLNADLEKRVQARTMILEEALKELGNSREELSKALNKEKELNELKSRFVSMASHEFRTPLATILSSLALVSRYGEQGEKEKQAKHINRIKSAIVHLTDILNDVLSLSKLEEGKVHVSRDRFNLFELATELVQEMQAIAIEDQEIIYSHSGEQIVVLDKNILKHILFNLLSNALKFSPARKPVYVTSEIKNGQLTITVKDLGIGISEEDQNHLFERFFRGHNATNIQGTGLGLNIVAKYVEMIGGTIHFQSALEQGTTFTVHVKQSQVFESAPESKHSI